MVQIKEEFSVKKLSKQYASQRWHRKISQVRFYWASDILTKEEIVSLVRYLNFVSSSPAGFPETKRCQNIHRCCRFLNTTKRCFYNGTEDNIDFSVDEDIKLHGVRFYGSEHSNYTINLMLSIKQTGLVLLSLKNKEVQTTGSVNFDSYGIEVPFDKEVVARKKNSVLYNCFSIRSSFSKRNGWFQFCSVFRCNIHIYG